MMDREVKLLLEKVQISRASHQKNVKLLENMYKRAHYDRFRDIFISYLRTVILKKALKNEYIERTLDFMANFVSVISLNEETNEDSMDTIDSMPTHTFLKDIIEETLNYHNAAIEAIRYHACLFVQLILNYLGNQVTLDNDICDTIQNAMLERTMDSKSIIRLHAIIALARLQDPTNKDCPVINAYLSLMKESNPRIRAEVVKIIAPAKVHNVTMHIKDRLRDVDHHVRSNTFKRIGELSPRFFRIVERQDIMKCGIRETHEVTKKAFTDYLLPKWLNFYDRNFVLLLSSLKFDAEEADMINTEEISQEVMNIYMSSVPMEDITKSVPINGDRLIPQSALSLEVVLLWNSTVTYLRKSEDLEEYLEELVPELTPFCHYIESFIDEFHKKTAEEYERLDYNSTLYYLFGMAEEYDFTDEVGRKTLSRLVMKVLKQDRLQFRLTKKLVEIALALANKNDDFTNTMCEIISEIREPLVAVEAPPKQSEDVTNKFQIASIKVKLGRLDMELETALDKQEFLEANELKQQITYLRKELEELTKPVPAPTEMVRTVKDDPSTICWCLDLLIATLELPGLKKITQSLHTVKDSFVMPLLDSSKVEINWRVLNVLALYATLDPSLAEALTKILLIPIITYRVIPNHVKEAILVAIKTVSDVFSLYGPEIFGQSENSSDGHQTRRRLYTEEADESLTNPNNFSLESIVDVLLDMMDDDNAEIVETSALALTKLILNGFPATPAFVTRIILKWYNPATVTISCNLQQILGVMIGNYSANVKGAKDIIAKAVIPILTSIAAAPSTSPLSEVDMDNLIHFLTAITNPDMNQVDVINTHVALAHSLCYEILKKKNPQLMYYLTKMLMGLEIPSEDKLVLEEVISLAEVLLDEEAGLDRQPRKFVEKFVQRLKAILERDYTNRDSILELTSVNNTENSTKTKTELTSNNASTNERTNCGEDEENGNSTDGNVKDKTVKAIVGSEKEPNESNSENKDKENNTGESDKSEKSPSNNNVNKESATKAEKLLPPTKRKGKGNKGEIKNQNKQAEEENSDPNFVTDSSTTVSENLEREATKKKRTRTETRKDSPITEKAADGNESEGTSSSDVENHSGKKQKVLNEETSKGGKRKQHVKHKNNGSSDSEPVSKRQRLSSNRASVRKILAVRMKQMTPNTIRKASNKQVIVRTTSKAHSPQGTLPITKSMRKSVPVDGKSNIINTSQSQYGDTPRPQRKNGYYNRLSEALSSCEISPLLGRPQNLATERDNQNSQGSSGTTDSPKITKNTRKNGIVNKLFQELSTSESSDENHQKVQKTKVSNLKKQATVKRTNGLTSNATKSPQASRRNTRKNPEGNRVPQALDTSSDCSSPRIQRTPSALEILNKNREKRNSEGNQREIRIPKRFSGESNYLINVKEKMPTGSPAKKVENKQKVPETSPKKDKFMESASKLKEKQSERLRNQKEKSKVVILSSVILREKNSQGPQKTKDSTQNKSKKYEDMKSRHNKSKKSVSELNEVYSENSKSSSDEGSSKHLKSSLKLRGKTTDILKNSVDQTQKSSLSESKALKSPSGIKLSPRKYPDTPHVKRKAKQNLMKHMLEVSRLSSDSRTSSRRSRSLGSNKFDDSADTTLLHTIVHEVSHNISLMDSSEISSPLSRKSLNSSVLSMRSLRSNSQVTSAGSIISLRQRSRLQTK